MGKGKLVIKANAPHFFMAFIALVFFVHRVLMIRKSGKRFESDPFCLALGILALSAIVIAPESRNLIDSSTGIPGVARWLSSSFGLLTSCALQVMAVQFVHGADVRIRVRVIIAVAAIFVLGALLLPQRLSDREDFVAAYSDHPAIVLYYLIITGYVGVVAANLLLLAVRYSRFTRQNYLKYGMHLVAWGACLAIAYSAYRGATSMFTFFGRDLPGRESVMTPLLAIPSGVLTVIGGTLTVWGPQAMAPIRSQRYRRDLKRIRPLWQLLTNTFPEVVLADVIGGKSPNVATRLHRCLVEINDCLLLLEPYRDPDVAKRAMLAAERSGLTGEHTRARAEAAALTDALARFLDPAQEPLRGRRAERDIFHGHDDETNWFRLVADALERMRPYVNR